MFALDAAQAEHDAEPDEDIDLNLITAIANVDTFRNEVPSLENMGLYEGRMTRNLHRNRQALRELQTERKRNYEHDKREELGLARLQDLKGLPYVAPTQPSPNGSVFSTEEITRAAERQRNFEANMYLIRTQAPWKKYGATGAGSPDLFADLPYRAPPDNLPQKIHGVSPESIALRKFYHPEEFEKRRH